MTALEDHPAPADLEPPTPTPGPGPGQRPNREARRRIALTVRVVLDPDLEGQAPLELTIPTRGADYFRAEEVTGIDPWEALGDLAGAQRVSNRFLRALHGLGFVAARRVAPTAVPSDWDGFLDRCVEVSVVDPSSEETADARPTVGGATSG